MEKKFVILPVCDRNGNNVVYTVIPTDRIKYIEEYKGVKDRSILHLKDVREHFFVSCSIFSVLERLNG